jgi:hypothetical protein
MQHGKSTKITIKENKAVGVASPRHGSNVAVAAFNIGFIAHKKPLLAIKIMEMYKEASKISENDPEAADEDYKLAQDKLVDLMNEVFDKL